MKKLKDGTFFVKVGETFTTKDGTKLRCTLSVIGCGGCHFSGNGIINSSEHETDGFTLLGCNGYRCIGMRRSDKKSVRFVRV